MENLQILNELETKLRDISHDDNPLKIIQDFSAKLKNTAKRQDIFNTENALVQQPIIYENMLEMGLIDASEDSFVLLQGDIVSTDLAYLCGERLEGMKFAIASSTCDLVPNRREYAVLLRLEPIRYNYPEVKTLINNLLRFSSTKRMYLPPLPDDPDEVIANSIVFDGVVQIHLKDLLFATRHGSLSLVGWRIFGSLVRTIMVRTGESEVKMRTAFNSRIN